MAREKLTHSTTGASLTNPDSHAWEPAQNSHESRPTAELLNEDSETEPREPETSDPPQAQNPRTLQLLALALHPWVAILVIASFWARAFRGFGGDGIDYPILGGAVALFCCTMIVGLDWRVFRRRAAILLILPLVGVCIASGFAVHDIAMEARGVIAHCEVWDKSTYRVVTRSGSHWKTEYDLDCNGFLTTASRKTDSKPEDPDQDDYADPFENLGPGPNLPSIPERETIRAEYDPEGLLETRIENISRDPYLSAFAALVFLLLSILIRTPIILITKPTGAARA